MDPRELTLLVAAVANGLYDSMPAEELAVLAAVFNQLGDTLETLAAQAARLKNGRTGTC
ncbi:MAG: hypothetical protein K2N78_01950 [Oscillospiraceae bacterium]|nr:hypothetical protein [Oscillospiraceae bacterium]